MKYFIRSLIQLVVAVVMLFLSSHVAFAQDEPPIPEYINSILSKYNEINEKGKMGYRFTGATLDTPFLARSLERYEIIYFADLGFGQILFDKLPDGNASRSFSVVTPSLSVSITALTMVVIDNSLSLIDARPAAREYLLSYDGSTEYSDVITIGDYSLVFYIKPNNEYVLNVMHKSDINAPVDKSLYQNASFQDIIYGKKSGEKICLRGRVEKQHTVYYNSIPIELVIFSSGGKQYRLQFLYCSFLEKLITGREYTFYGAVAQQQEDGYACIILHHYVE